VIEDVVGRVYMRATGRTDVCKRTERCMLEKRTDRYEVSLSAGGHPSVYV
jgi:hypothetical protein